MEFDSSGADGDADGFAPGAGFAAGVHPAEDVVDEFVAVGRVVVDQVGRGGVERGKDAGRGISGRRGADDVAFASRRDARE